MPETLTSEPSSRLMIATWASHVFGGKPSLSTMKKKESGILAPVTLQNVPSEP